MLTKVWVPVEGAWEIGEVIYGGTVREKMTITVGEREVVVNSVDLRAVDEASLQLLDDLIKLDDLCEPTVLYNLLQRYKQNMIYTYVGPIIISINPFQKIASCRNEVLEDYIGDVPPEQLPPHLYALAKNAFESLLRDGIPQAIIISGESGSGKTEATKIMLKFLTVISHNSGKEIAEALLATNPILEAFGNAKTLKNNNSSRFGKLIKINFSSTGIIEGATINSYLLESTRVVYQAPEERNYHIFYALINGANESMRKRYRLKGSTQDYHYLSHGSMSIPESDDLHLVLNSFVKIGFSNEQIDQILKLLSGILLLGNIEFQGAEKVEIRNKVPTLDHLCELLMVSSRSMEEALISKKFVGGGRTTSYSIPLTMEQAIENRDAMAKSIYTRLFDYIISQLNLKLSSKDPPNTWISILDIYGFEIFQKNSLEQFCINYANEKLHEQFNENMFKVEQAEYSREGIPWQTLSFTDNKECINLIEKPITGIISLLNEECQIPQGSDSHFVRRLYESLSKHPFFGYSLRTPNLFEVKHFAGTVPYDVDGFLNKNKNTLNADIAKLLSASSLPLIRELFFTEEKGESTDLPRKRVERKKVEQSSKISVCQSFRKDLENLCSLLQTANRHYVRCIKPNPHKEPNNPIPAYILQQLLSNGVIETIALRKAGYSNKMSIESFYHRYAILNEQMEQTKESISEYLSQLLNDEEWVIGNTKIFFRSTAIQQLEDLRVVAFRKIIINCQKFVRRFISTQIFSEKRQRLNAIYCLQKYVRALNAQLELDKEKERIEEEKRREEERLAEERRIEEERRREEERRLEEERLEEERQMEEERRLEEERLEEEGRQKAWEEERRREEERRLEEVRMLEENRLEEERMEEEKRREEERALEEEGMEEERTEKERTWEEERRREEEVIEQARILELELLEERRLEEERRIKRTTEQEQNRSEENTYSEIPFSPQQIRNESPSDQPLDQETILLNEEYEALTKEQKATKEVWEKEKREWNLREVTRKERETERAKREEYRSVKKAKLTQLLELKQQQKRENLERLRDVLDFEKKRRTKEEQRREKVELEISTLTGPEKRQRIEEERNRRLEEEKRKTNLEAELKQRANNIIAEFESIQQRIEKENAKLEEENEADLIQKKEDEEQERLDIIELQNFEQTKNSKRAMWELKLADIENRRKEIAAKKEANPPPTPKQTPSETRKSSPLSVPVSPKPLHEPKNFNSRNKERKAPERSNTTLTIGTRPATNLTQSTTSYSKGEKRTKPNIKFTFASPRTGSELSLPKLGSAEQLPILSPKADTDRAAKTRSPPMANPIPPRPETPPPMHRQTQSQSQSPPTVFNRHRDSYFILPDPTLVPSTEFNPQHWDFVSEESSD
eukprot:TRINITY_DN7861_c0_g1_i2.p1 TRINITY_DN7861_c0_g1~~TRINITY_DN7861_c0_g1_i2.p1  ORF type:complete len:1374 (-),score=438.93 TRINITY_DN7861_c0_g1_i2:103-4224(-)